MSSLKRGFAAAALLLSASGVALAADGTFDKTLNVNGVVMLHVDTGAGYIHVTPGSGSQVHIVGHVHAGKWGWGHGSPEERVKHVVDNPPIEQSGNSIAIGRHDDDRLENISIDYEITTPKNTSLQAESGSGDLHIAGLSGSLKAVTGSGSIDASGMAQQTSLEAGSGDIRAEMAGPGSVKANTGSGTLRLKNVTGGLSAETGSGDLQVSGAPGSPWKLETGSGSVLLTTGSAKYTLDAETGSGGVHSDPPMTVHGSMDRNHVVGDINGGGPRVRVETGSGEVRIR